MSELHSKISNYPTTTGGDYTVGTDLMASGDTVVLAIGSYRCSEGTCSKSVGERRMVMSQLFSGLWECESHYEAQCVIDCESSDSGSEGRKGIVVMTTNANGGTLTIKALTFFDALANFGAGLNVNGDSNVDLHFCKFVNCRSNIKSLGGGAMMVNSYGGPSNINIYSTTFTNDIDGEADIFTGSNTVVSIHDTCPSPYSSNTPIQGSALALVPDGTISGSAFSYWGCVGAPTPSPTGAPTPSPTEAPTGAPTTSPTEAPTGSPTTSPMEALTGSPTTSPTEAPTGSPTTSPTVAPTVSPTESPVGSGAGSESSTPDCSGQGTSWGPGIGPPPDGCGSDSDSGSDSGSGSGSGSPPTTSPTESPTVENTGAPTAESTGSESPTPDCSGRGTTWGPGIGPPPDGCEGGGAGGDVDAPTISPTSPTTRAPYDADGGNAILDGGVGRRCRNELAALMTSAILSIAFLGLGL